jgi:flagellar basal body-associated protein FliL
MPVMKIVFGLMIVLVLAALASAGVFMLRKDGDSESQRSHRMARALALRVALSVALFLLILLAWQMGWVKPGGLPAGR